MAALGLKHHLKSKSTADALAADRANVFSLAFNIRESEVRGKIVELGLSYCMRLFLLTSLLKKNCGKGLFHNGSRYFKAHIWLRISIYWLRNT